MALRLLASLIVIFWLTMTGLLLKSEFSPSHSKLREVPPSHVLRLLFQHSQTSDLRIISSKTPLGRLQIHPSKLGNDRLIEFSGNLRLQQPTRLRIAWDGQLLLSDSLELKSLSFDFSTQDPQPARAQILILPNLATVRWHNHKGLLLSEQSFAMDAAGLQQILIQSGFDSSLFTSFKDSTPPQFKAQQSTLLIRSENVDTYLVSLEQGDQTLLDIQISQTGQILAVKSFLGYEMEPDALMP